MSYYGKEMTSTSAVSDSIENDPTHRGSIEIATDEKLCCEDIG